MIFSKDLRKIRPASVPGSIFPAAGFGEVFY
nr:MAG TPA: hypothetical protein [Caudoviricetes sp.]